MTVKQWLSRAYRIKEIIQMLEEEKEQAFEAAVGVTAPVGMEKIKCSGGNGPERRNVEYSNYSILLDKKTTELKQIQAEIEGVISQIKKNDRYEILHRRYAKCEKFIDIADAMCLSERQVFRIHKQALHDTEKILKKDMLLH